MQRRTVLKGISVIAAESATLLDVIETLAAAENSGSDSTDASVLSTGALQRPEETVRGDMRYRKLGRTGEVVSLIGVGGYHIGSVKEEKEAIQIIHAAIDRGVTFMDNCWDYHDGESERRMGKASMQILEQALHAVKTFTPLGVTEMQTLLARTQEAAKYGRYERFKTDNPFDSTAKNPAWLG